jgi:hypothetical protein
MELFRTILKEPVATEKIDYASPIVVMGSCFAENIGLQLQRLKCDLVLNPFGIVFHPLPLARNLERMIAATRYTKDELLCHQELWFSFDHHGRFSHTTADSCLHRINEELQQGHRQLRRAEWLFVTFGTAWAYRLKKEGIIVANCHKYTTSAFDRIKTEADEIYAIWEKTLARLHAFNPRAKVVFTVSPIRHLRDGAHENQLSKAALLLAVDRLCKTIPQTRYFPAYEIMLDDLRDYRFYAEDMVHPSPLAIRYIWQHFSNTFLTDDTVATMKEVESILKSVAHRPIHRHAMTRKFAADCLDRIKMLQQRLPQLDFTEEVQCLEYNSIQ